MDENKVYDASTDAKMEERATVDVLRDDSQQIQIGDLKVGKITGYNFHILIRDKEALTGHLTREEVDLIYRLYSTEGSNLTQRTVSRYFPRYTFQDFKRILRAFNITKASSPIAPHVIEEETTDRLVELTIQNKENDYLRKLEQDRNRLIEVKLKEMTKQYYELRQKQSDFSEFLGGIKFDVKITNPKDKVKSDKHILVYLSDMHMGADVSKYSIYSNEYNKKEVENRMNKVLDYIYSLVDMTQAGNITICNLGDSLDGYNGETTRGGHSLPQNMNNKDQYKSFIQVMINLFANLSNSGMFNNISYVCVESGNHDGDFGWMANKSLEGCLSIMNPEINVKIFDKFIEHFTVGNHTMILCHGKDAKDMFRNMPLVLNDKIENQIGEYIDYHKLSGNIHFVKGDLHQSATTYGKRFRYKSVSSFFGSSQWIHVNFGNTSAAIDFDIINNDTILETRLILN